MQKKVLNPGAQQEKLSMNHCSNYGHGDCKNSWLISIVCRLAGGLMTFYCPDLKSFKKRASSRASRQMDTERVRTREREREKSKMILWWSWFTDLNCSVHSVAHSYFSPRQSELKLEEFKVTFMFSYDAFGSASCSFYETANSSQSDFHCRPGFTHYTVYYRGPTWHE